MNRKKATIGFEKQLWDAACVLWGHIPVTEYRKIIVGLIFLRSLSCTFRKKYRELAEEGLGRQEDAKAYEDAGVFFLPPVSRWESIRDYSGTEEIGKALNRAMQEIENCNPVLKNVLPKEYENEDLDKEILGNVVNLFSTIDMDDIEEDKDLLGRTYEYCLNRFAAMEGKSGGQFYTPGCIVKTLISVLKPFPGCTIYDCCSGSGGMFVQGAKYVASHNLKGNIRVYGQEAEADTRRMAIMNMAVRGIHADFGPKHADTFLVDLHKGLQADIAISNPPFNYTPWIRSADNDKDPRWIYGVPPANNGNFAWMQHMLYHLKPDGRMGVVMANGALSTETGNENEIRKALVENDLVECIIMMPAKLFYSVRFPVSLWILSKEKKQKGKTLFIDASAMGHNIDKQHADLSEEDIECIADTVEQFRNGTLTEIKGFSRIADISDIAKQKYNLVPGRYVGLPDDTVKDTDYTARLTELHEELRTLTEQSRELEEQFMAMIKEAGL